MKRSRGHPAPLSASHADAVTEAMRWPLVRRLAIVKCRRCDVPIAELMERGAADPADANYLRTCPAGPLFLGSRPMTKAEKDRRLAALTQFGSRSRRHVPLDVQYLAALDLVTQPTLPVYCERCDSSSAAPVKELRAAVEYAATHPSAPARTMHH